MALFEGLKRRTARQGIIAMTLSISIGKYGGFYLRRDYTARLCLGWVAFTWYPFDIDAHFRKVGAAREALVRECIRLEALLP